MGWLRGKETGEAIERNEEKDGEEETTQQRKHQTKGQRETGKK